MASAHHHRALRPCFFPGAAQISSGKFRRRRGNDAGRCISSVFEQAHARRTDSYPRTDRSQHSRLIAVSLWGRARASAEMQLIGRIGMPVLVLQWGRARASAEIASRNPPAAPDLRFNGAALVRARKSPTRPHRSSRAMGFNGAALVRARKWSNRRRRIQKVVSASMGPRSCERGNVYCPRGTRARTRSFNGAALVRARKYGMTAFILSPLDGELQWGRARASAEMSHAVRRTGRARRASMGPRSCERGNVTNVTLRQ